MLYDHPYVGLTNATAATTTAAATAAATIDTAAAAAAKNAVRVAFKEDIRLLPRPQYC